MNRWTEELSLADQAAHHTGRQPILQRAQAIAAQVKEWKTKGALYLPNFPKEKIAEMKGSLDYPSEGSPQYAVKPA